jgi:tRNA threonylcarbamoyladenosine biosynthesis protein TsaE
MTYESNSVEETEAIAGRLVARLRGGDVLALEGDLGAGKTQFVRGLVRALGGDPRTVSSPTYVLLHVYNTQSLTIYHLDAYRVHGAGAFEQIGFEELLEQGGIVVVEWPSRVPELLPKTTIRIRIETTGETARQITILDPGKQ